MAVISERRVRYDRLARRKERPLSEDEAESRDYAEIEKLEKGGPIAIADFVLVNNGKRKKLIKKLDRLIEKLDFEPK